MQRRPLAASAADDDSTSSERPRRAAIEEVQRLGGLYAVLNYAAPLARLHALCILLFGGAASAPFKPLILPSLAPIVVGVTRVPLFKLGGHYARLVGADEKLGDTESSAFHQIRLVASQLMRVVLLVGLMPACAMWFDPVAAGLGWPEDGGRSAALHGAGAAAAFAAVWSLVHAF